MIIINATAKGENTYEITVGENALFRVSAFDLESAIDIVADYIESHEMSNLYIAQCKLVAMAEHSKYYSADIFARVHGLVRCGTNNIYLEVTSVKGVEKMSKDEWYEVVSAYLAEHYALTDDALEDATEDIVGRCFCYGVPTLSELPEYIAEYMDR
jgi:hypothetical protein